MEKLAHATLLFLIQRGQKDIVQICLAMKKRGLGQAKWNGVGGKVEHGETIEEAILREAVEEIGVRVLTVQKVGEFAMKFPHDPNFAGQVVHAFLTEEWEGVPSESEEMAPRWFTLSDIPYETMWADLEVWLPRVLKGEKLVGNFVFAEGDVISDQELEVVSGFE